MKFLVSENQFKNVISKIHEQMEQYLLNEGANEDRALSLLKKSKIENVEEIFEFLKNVDKSKNHKLLPVIAFFYINTKNNEEYKDIVKTFEKINKQKNVPDITIEGDKVKVLGEEFSSNYFEGFKDFIDHYYFEKDEKEEEEEKKLYDIKANKIFENDNFEVYYAASEQVCIKLFGRDNEERLFIKRGYCIGWGKLDKPEEYYSRYRDPSNTHKKTFYIVVDKKLYENYLKTGEDHPSLINVVGVREDFDQTGKYFVWDRNNPGDGDRVEGYSSVEDYIKHLEDGGINLKIFRPVVYKTKSGDVIRKMQSNPSNDSLFMSLLPKQKFTYVSSFAKSLTPLQMKFMLKKMPKEAIESFVKNYEVLGDLSTETFNLMNQNLQTSFLRSKLKQLTNGLENFNFDNFFEYMTNTNNINFAIAFIKDSFTNEANPNKNTEQSRRVLGLLSPQEFFESLKGENHVIINEKNFKVDALPENLSEYLSDASHLEIENLNKLKNIPESIGMCKNLLHLEIKNCSLLESIPESIGQLTQLEFLGLQRNKKLTSIPPSIGNLTNVSHLALQGNSSLTELPESVGSMTNLSLINLDGTPLRTIPREQLQKLPDLTFITHDETTTENLSDEDKEFLENL